MQACTVLRTAPTGKAQRHPGSLLGGVVVDAENKVLQHQRIAGIPEAHELPMRLALAGSLAEPK